MTTRWISTRMACSDLNITERELEHLGEIGIVRSWSRDDKLRRWFIDDIERLARHLKAKQ